MQIFLNVADALDVLVGLSVGQTPWEIIDMVDVVELKVDKNTPK